MKKIITMLVGIVLPFNIFADDKTGYHIKSSVGFNHMVDKSFSNNNYKGHIKLKDQFPMLEIGIGKQFSDDFRGDLSFNYNFVVGLTELSSDNFKQNYVIKSNVRIDSLMLNLYKNIFSYNKLTHYVGVGIGCGKIKESSTAYKLFPDGKLYKLNDAAKIVHKFGYKLTTGIELAVSENIKVDLSYNYVNFGVGREAKIGAMRNMGNKNYAIHNMTFGMRFDI